MQWIIKASYPSGGHIVMENGERLRFSSKQDAENRAEILNSFTKMSAARSMRVNDTTYIVVEETV